MVSIRLENVSKHYGETAAVDRVSLEVRRGELFFLLGPSGCGKTTILRMIAGFCEPDEGEIYFDDRPISSVPAHRRNTSLVFQNYALWPHMNVAENVAYGLEERRVAKAERQERVQTALRRVRMDEYGGRMPNQLSGGQQQRIALARALVVEPDAVLMDEPLSNLDARLRLEMRHEILRIHQETGITMLYVTHDQKEALSMADRVAVMTMGEVAQIGDPRSVYRHPASRFVANFIGEANLIPGTLAAADGAYGRARTALGEFRAVLGSGLRCCCRTRSVGPRPSESAEGQEAEGGDSAVPIADAGRRSPSALAAGRSQDGVLQQRPKDAGAGVLCMVRPECLHLGAAAGNAFRARVVSSLYLGEMEQFVLDAGGQELRAVVANPGDRAPRHGDEVDVCFAPEDAVLLPAEEGLAP